MIELVKGKRHDVVKRNGSIEPYDPKKMEKVIRWAVITGNEHLDKGVVDVIVEELLTDINIKIHDKITIQKLFDEVISTAANKISEIQPIWDSIARNLYIQKIYKETWGIKRDQYPDFVDVLKKGIQYKVYDKNVIDTFTEDELNEIGDYIEPSNDFKFTFGGLNLFMDKYSIRYTKTKHLELPQQTYMRVAMFFHYSDRKNRIQNIKDEYDILSKHLVTKATPKMLNSLRKNPQMASCVLMRPSDDSKSINAVANAMGLFSKFAGGLAVDVSWISSKGRPIESTGGESSGVIPFIQMYEKVIKAYNQGGKRPGACAIYFDWFHAESQDIAMLKDAGGKDDERARALKYTIKWNRVLTERFLKDEEITLFNPYDTPGLQESFSDDFKQKYEALEQKTGIKKKKMKARDFVMTPIKIRSETGNLYVFFRDNVDEQRMGRDPVYMSNLCTEVFLDNKPLEVSDEVLTYNLDSKEYNISIPKTSGEIALCNLASFNLVEWSKLSHEEKFHIMYITMIGFDNAIENAYYPMKAGELFNKTKRAIGIGVSNYANYIASNKTKMTDENAKKLTHEIFEDLYWYVYFTSTEIAKERGRYDAFEGSKWEQGMVPLDVSILNRMDSDLNYPLLKDWDLIRNRIKEFGVRFSYHAAIAPTATSGLVISSTEGTESIKEYKIMKEGTYNLPFMAPNLKHNRMYYELAWDIPNETLMDLAAIRQKFIDQGQSINLYYKETDSASEIIKDIIYAERLGLKSLYYLNPMKAEMEESCESCSS